MAATGSPSSCGDVAAETAVSPSVAVSAPSSAAADGVAASTGGGLPASAALGVVSRAGVGSAAAGSSSLASLPGPAGLSSLSDVDVGSSAAGRSVSASSPSLPVAFTGAAVSGTTAATGTGAGMSGSSADAAGGWTAAHRSGVAPPVRVSRSRRARPAVSNAVNAAAALDRETPAALATSVTVTGPSAAASTAHTLSFADLFRSTVGIPSGAVMANSPLGRRADCFRVGASRSTSERPDSASPYRM